jgi:hypothetical protein
VVQQCLSVCPQQLLQFSCLQGLHVFSEMRRKLKPLGRGREVRVSCGDAGDMEMEADLHISHSIACPHLQKG